MITPTDRIIPFYVRFMWGFGYISVLIGLINFGMNLITMVTVKEIYIPLWVIPIVGGIIILGCTYIGWYFEKYNIQNRITSHLNQAANPEFTQLCKDVKEIKNKLESEK